MGESTTHWSKAGEAGTVFGMRLLLIMYRLSGRWGFRLLLAPVLAYFFVTRRDARRASAQYLNRVSLVLDDTTTHKLSVFRHFWMFGETLLDKLLVWMNELPTDKLVVETPVIFDEINNSKRGGVIVVSHLGNTEVCGALAHRLPGVSITMLVYTRHARKFNRLMKSAQKNSDLKIMQVVDISPATAMLLSERVSAGEYIAIAGDRTPVTGQLRTSQVDFLGEPASMPQGAFILAGILNCPVYLLFCLKQKDRYHLYLERFSEQMRLPRKQRDSVVNAEVQRYADRLGHYCTIAPLQWFNFYPFWRH